MKVSLVGRTVPVDNNIKPDEFPAFIARIGKVKDNPEKLLSYLVKNKHFSPFEHNFLTFEIETSKAIGIQLLRHRSFTFQELSQRYQEINKFEDFELRMEHPTNRQSSTEVFDPEILFIDQVTGEQFSMSAINAIAMHLDQVQNLYKVLLEEGVAKECARMILPLCTSTTILMTGSIRSWIHFLEVRDEEHAQKEIQNIAKEIKKIFCSEFPTISKSLSYI